MADISPDEALAIPSELIPDPGQHEPEAALAPQSDNDPETYIGLMGRRKKRYQGNGTKGHTYAKKGNDPLDRLVARRRAQSILALKLEGRSPKEIAEELNIPRKCVYWALYQLRRGGHLQAQDEVVNAIEHSIKPLVVERLEERLLNPDVDQELLIEAAKGTGVFVSHAKIKQEGAAIQQALVVKFELPEGPVPVAAFGEIHGAPMAGN